MSSVTFDVNGNAQVSIHKSEYSLYKSAPALLQTLRYLALDFEYECVDACGRAAASKCESCVVGEMRRRIADAITKATGRKPND